ncbi:hypothetical protein PENSPDRAFT_512054 [Peniophora sp. CONT]|nr:hypothetical protein PENSPDRAFT_512054 [Peniophora sp. CONT]
MHGPTEFTASPKRQQSHVTSRVQIEHPRTRAASVGRGLLPNGPDPFPPLRRCQACTIRMPKRCQRLRVFVVCSRVRPPISLDDLLVGRLSGRTWLIG